MIKRVGFALASCLCVGLAGPVAANPSELAATYFLMGCLHKAPDFSESLQIFQAQGFTRKTDDARMRATPDRNFLGGIGVIVLQDKPLGTQPNSCVTYVRGTDPAAVERALDPFLRSVFPEAMVWRSGADTYWDAHGLESNTPILIILSPKNSGTYAGHVMLAVVNPM